MTNRMPVVFVGHGNPMNAISENTFTRGWAAIGRSLPRPRAILSVSAHYYIPFSMVTTSVSPPTIHDFSGFPEALYQVRYPAPGSVELARRVQDLLGPVPVKPDDSWGLDHGTWSVLKHMFPAADIPVLQLSIDETQPPKYHYDMGKKLLPLREEGVLIVGSGNIVHNLAAYDWNHREREPYDWAVQFEDFVRKKLMTQDHLPLIDYETFSSDARLAVPVPDHFLPLLYVCGLQVNAETVEFPVQGFDGGAVSMLAVRIG